MSYTHDDDVTINVFGDAMPVKRKSFGLNSVQTDELEAGFTQTHRIYSSPADVAADADLKPAAVAEVAGHFNQTPHPTQVQVGKVDFTTPVTLAASLDALRAATDVWFAQTTTSRVKADLVEMAAWSLTNKKLFGFQSSDADILTGVGGNVMDTINLLNNGYCWGIYHGVDAEPLGTSWMSAGLWPDPDQLASVWYHRQLIGVSADDITPAQAVLAKEDGSNLFAPFGGPPATNDGKLFDGSFVDDLIVREWFKARLQESLIQFQVDLAKRGQKIPYSAKGLGMVGGRILSVGKRAEEPNGIGHFQAGSVKVTIPELEDVADQDIVDRKSTLAVTAVTTGGIKEITLNVGVLSTPPLT